MAALSAAERARNHRLDKPTGGVVVTPIAITFLVLAIIVVWGGLIASTLYLRANPERGTYPPGDTDDHREDEAPVIRDT